MTAEEFLRDLAKRAEIIQVVPTDLDEDEDVVDHVEPALVIRLDLDDDDRFRDLVGLRVV